MMNILSSTGQTIPESLLKNYFQNLVNRFFKILPMRENGEDSLNTYMRSLSNELLGCEHLIPELTTHSSYLTLLSILEYLLSHPECDISIVRREVFRAISVCKKLEELFSSEGV